MPTCCCADCQAAYRENQAREFKGPTMHVPEWREMKREHLRLGGSPETFEEIMKAQSQMTDPEKIERAVDAMVAVWSDADSHPEIRATCADLLNAALASLQPVEPTAESALREFESAVPDNNGGGCPWCLSREHWAGKLGMCPAPASRAITAALQSKEQGNG